MFYKCCIDVMIILQIRWVIPTLSEAGLTQLGRSHANLGDF